MRLIIFMDSFIRILLQNDMRYPSPTHPLAPIHPPTLAHSRAVHHFHPTSQTNSTRFYEIFFFGTSVLFTNATVTSRFKVKEWIASGKKTHMCTARPGWQTISLRSAKYKKTMWNVHVNLIDVLKVKLHGFNSTVHKLLQACFPFNKICSSLICSCQSFANRALSQ